jgi:hypothetical protein
MFYKTVKSEKHQIIEIEFRYPQQLRIKTNKQKQIKKYQKQKQKQKQHANIEQKIPGGMRLCLASAT